MSWLTKPVVRGILRKAALPAAALVLAAAGAATALAQTVIKIGTQTQNDVQHEYMKMYKAAVEKASGGKFRVDLFPAAQLGPFPRVIEGLRLGNIEGAVGPYEFFVGVDPRFQVPAMAGVFRDNAHARKVWDNAEARKLFADIADQRGMAQAGIMVFDMQMFTFKAPATKLADFKGRRIRVLASETEQAAVQALGSASIPMPLPEVLPALQQGTIDGVNSAIGVFTPFRYYDAAPNAIDTRLWGIMTPMMLSKAWLTKLPAADQKMLLDAGRAIEPENHKWLLEKLKADRETWTKNGGKIVSLSPDEQKQAEKLAGEATVKVLEKYPPVKETYDKLRAVAAAIK